MCGSIFVRTYKLLAIADWSDGSTHPFSYARVGQTKKLLPKGRNHCLGKNLGKCHRCAAHRCRVVVQSRSLLVSEVVQSVPPLVPPVACFQAAFFDRAGTMNGQRRSTESPLAPSVPEPPIFRRILYSCSAASTLGHDPWSLRRGDFGLAPPPPPRHPLWMAAEPPERLTAFRRSQGFPSVGREGFGLNPLLLAMCPPRFVGLPTALWPQAGVTTPVSLARAEKVLGSLPSSYGPCGGTPLPISQTAIPTAQLVPPAGLGQVPTFKKHIRAREILYARAKTDSFTWHCRSAYPRLSQHCAATPAQHNNQLNKQVKAHGKQVVHP